MFPGGGDAKYQFAGGAAPGTGDGGLPAVPAADPVVPAADTVVPAAGPVVPVTGLEVTSAGGGSCTSSGTIRHADLKDVVPFPCDARIGIKRL